MSPLKAEDTDLFNENVSTIEVDGEDNFDLYGMYAEKRCNPNNQRNQSITLKMIMDRNLNCQESKNEPVMNACDISLLMACKICVKG